MICYLLVTRHWETCCQGAIWSLTSFLLWQGLHYPTWSDATIGRPRITFSNFCILDELWINASEIVGYFKLYVFPPWQLFLLLWVLTLKTSLLGFPKWQVSVGLFLLQGLSLIRCAVHLVRQNPPWWKLSLGKSSWQISSKIKWHLHPQLSRMLQSDSFSWCRPSHSLDVKNVFSCQILPEPSLGVDSASIKMFAHPISSLRLQI